MRVPMIVSRIKDPKYICLLSILYQFIMLLFLLLALIRDGSALALYLFPATMQFVFLSRVILSENMSDAAMYAALLLLAIPIVLELIGWILAKDCKWKGYKLIRIPSWILLISHLLSLCLLFGIGLAVFFVGNLIYLSVLLGVVIPSLTLWSYNKWK